MTLGQRIQHHRTKLNLSQEALGEKLGVTRQAVHKWEADGAVPDTDKLIALSKLFGITLNELLQVEEPKKTENVAEEASASEESANPSPKKQGIDLKLRTTLMSIAIIILGIATLVCAVNIATLQKEVASLKEQSVGLDPAAPLVASFDFDLRCIRSAVGRNVSIYADLLPYQLAENLEVSFTLSSTGAHKISSAVAEWSEGGHYTATLNMDAAADPLTVTATISDGMNEYAQPLVRIDSFQPNSYSWVSLWDK